MNLTDALSDVLSFVDVRSARCTRLEAGGRWAFTFPAKPALKFAAVLEGECWITLPGEPPQPLSAGDIFLLAEAPDYVLANDLDLAPEDGLAAFDWAHSDVARYGRAETVLVAGSFIFDASHARRLIEALPAFLLVPKHDPAASTLRSLLDVIDREIRSEKIGAAVVTQRLAEVLLVQVVRGYVERTGGAGAGWLSAAGDRQIGVALKLMHGRVADRWTVGDLARAVGMSRSAFATAFKDKVGASPLDYLRRWRMEIALKSLRRGEAVAAIAAEVGYASESAFSNAFKRVYGRSPRHYGRSEPCG